jgi:hypothetical protein
MIRKATYHPAWATKYRDKGKELRFINGKYYLYEYKTIYDKEKKRPKKISGGLIGSITEQGGLIPSPKRVLKTAALQSHAVFIRHFCYVFDFTAYHSVFLKRVTS